MGCISKKNMAAPEQGPITLPGKKKCFACKETSHNLDQCRIKDKLGTVARLFGRSTSFPFYMIQPSKEVVKNEKLYHHCLLITSNTCNLDPARVKTELNKFWELTDDWDIRREGRQNFVASFNSEDDLLSCLKPPNVETFLDEKEVNFSVAMWDGGDGEKLDLIKEWLLVYGVPDAYRNWKELYQVASAVGVLLEVDEESLESGDKEPIRLRIALGSLVGAPFSYHFVFGWSSRLVEFMIEDKVRRIEGQWKEVEERNVSVMKEYADAREEGIEVPPETMNKGIDLEGTGVDFAGNSSLDFRSCSGKECKEELKTTEQNGSVRKEYADIREEGIEVPPETLNEGMDLEATGVDFTGNCSFDLGSCSGKECKEELKNTETATLLEAAKFIAELRADEDIKGNSASAMAATTTNSKNAAKGGQSPSENSAGGYHLLGLEDCSDKERQKKLKTCDMATFLQASKCTEELRIDGEIKENNASAIVGTRTNSERATEDIPKATEDMATLLQVSKFTEELRTDGEIKENSASAIVGTRTNSERATEDIPKAEGGQSICGSMDKPAIKNVYTRRNRKQKESTEGSTLFAHINSDSTCEGIQKPPIKNAYEGSDPKQKGYTGGQVASMELNKAMNPGSSSHADCTRNKTEAKTLGAEGAQSIKGSSACMIRVTRSKGVDEAGTTLQGDRLTQFYEEFNTYNEIYDSFVEMGLRENLLKGIYAYGLEKPSAVHQRGIVPLCKGLDVIQQSLSGTTVTLACGVLQRLNYGSTECQALILVPTRDLAQETEKVIGALGQWLGVKAHACLGGTSIRGDKQSLSNSTQVIVATPSRALDMLRGQALCPDNIRMFVLDQADETLAGGLKNQIYDIIQLLPAKIQFAVFSTVMSHEALELCRKCMNKPMKVIVPKDEELESFSIKQFYVKAEEEELKFEKLCDLFDTMAVKQNIIFVDARQKVKSLTEKIRGRGYTVSASHGGMNQHERDVAVQDLRSGSSLVLVTTDLRGADTLQVPVVINYDLPTQAIQYIRHVRRSGQPGGNGVAISFIAPADRRVLSDIQRFCNAQMEELPSNVADLL
ncbi:ATP-dependent RNA helicase drs1-like isoform X3 [Hordeum vulgare subsp. vulgare]|uniref:ATP-dependent RNA helicase drs1-like isoform X3 n=1 Tax=Hordeum vulgare subsp. vulgare TaxID=112509 RepID=UPI001D1A4D54|nr:ATP-dependent RNA helicase drs1-like isoform X3 [Hordeum vulgare subsp. vulgare]